MDNSKTSFEKCLKDNSLVHYSIHENSVLYNKKKSKKIMRNDLELQANNCGNCITQTNKKSSLFSKISNLFCCYIPEKKRKEKKSNKSIFEKKVSSHETQHETYENPSIYEVRIEDIEKNHLNSYLQKDLVDEVNLMMPNTIQKKKSVKSGTGSTQSKCSYLKKHYIPSKLSQYPENSLFFLTNSQTNNFVIARIKINEFYPEESLNDDDGKNKYFNPKITNSLSHELKIMKLGDHLPSFDCIQTANKIKKCSIICLSDETKNENKNYTYDEKLRNSKQNYFKNLGRFEKKIKIDSESWGSMIPDKISTYFAKKCKTQDCEIILDAYCGSGINSLQFFKENFHVIAIDSKEIKCSNKVESAVDYAHYNSMVHGYSEAINFIKGDFLEINLNFMMVDAILINPTLKMISEKKFSLLKNPNFDYLNVMKKALTIGSNIILCLPRTVELNEIVELFSSIFNEMEHLEKNCIEIEYQFINKELQQIVVYYGDIAGITHKNICDFLAAMVNKDNKTCKTQQTNFIQSIISRIGVKTAAKYIVSAEKNQLSNETILQAFIDLVRINKEISVEDFDDCLKENEEIDFAATYNSDFELSEKSLLLKDSKEFPKNKTRGFHKRPKVNIYDSESKEWREMPINLKTNKETFNFEASNFSYYSGNNYSYYSSKIMSSFENSELNMASIKSKDPMKEYSFKKNSPLTELPKKSTMQEIVPRKNIEFLEFWDHKNCLNNKKIENHNMDKKFPDFKCKIIDFV